MQQYQRYLSKNNVFQGTTDEEENCFHLLKLTATLKTLQSDIKRLNKLS